MPETPKRTPELYIGLMTGTSLDGVDAALARFEDGRAELVHAIGRPLDSDLKRELLALNAPGANELERAALAANHLSSAYAGAVDQLLREAEVEQSQVTAIGSHGQTLRHRPESGFTIQIQNPALLAELTGLTVVADFRSRDVAAGGQGAPLVPAFHDQVFRDARESRGIVNIGGIGNVTALAADGAVTGFDTGPGNMLMDAWTLRHLHQPFDRDGAWAAQGQMLPALLDRFLSEPFFALPPPRSTGRDLFSLPWLEERLTGQEAPQDVQATLLELSARSIADAVMLHCPGTEALYLCGGGARNGFLRRRIAELTRLPVEPTDALGVSADWVEAFAFAWLARQLMRRQPGNLPAVTGAAHPCLLGAVYPA